MKTSSDKPPPLPGKENEEKYFKKTDDSASDSSAISKNSLNKKNKKGKRSNLKIYVSSFALLLIFAFTILPPWEYTFQTQGISQVVRPAGYHFIFNPPPPQHDRILYGVRLDLDRYIIQVSSIIFILITFLYLFKTNKKKKDSES